MDALAHCVEAFCSVRFNPIADAIALDGFERWTAHIELAVEDGTSRDARREMMLCALEGGLAFQKGLGAVHSLSHPLGGLVGRRLHHGTLNAIFLPHVLRFNHEACASKMDTLAHRMGLRDGWALPDALARLNGRLGLPTRLKDLGVTYDEVGPLAELAWRDHCTPTNPRPLDEESCRTLYRNGPRSRAHPIGSLALAHRLPSVHGLREGVFAGGLISLGPDLTVLARQGAAYVDKILKGAKPGELPIEQPARYELIINLKTAKALGLTIPPSLLQRADQVIE
jgi:hypothetical protein